MSTCICIKDDQGTIITPVIGCPACGDAALETAMKQIEEACRRVPGCTCALCRPKGSDK